jgi:hypothetical protein
MLEEHILPWMRKWGFGLGFHSEQGAESIHAEFNTMLRTYASTRNPVDRLKYILKEHLLRNSPTNRAEIPQTKKYKKHTT